MSNIVYVDFQRQQQVTEAELYLNLCAAELDEADFWDLCDGIRDPNVYQQLDPDMQDLVDGFWACRQKIG
jgi:hypothetical protein